VSAIPAGTELLRPFLPTEDFDLSKRFYETLGFEKVLDSEVAIFRRVSSNTQWQRTVIPHDTVSRGRRC
jgi:hypothetical protein